MSVINVAVGVVLRNNECFICKRSLDQHQGGKWEFPGGKIESGETPEVALRRELHEEIGIQCTDVQHLITIEHDYSDKRVNLITFTVSGFHGEPQGLEGQPVRWASLDDLEPSDFPEANAPIIDALTTLER